MSNGKTVVLQKVLKKIENLETRVKRIEKESTIGIVRLSDKEMADIRKIKKEMSAGKEYSFEEVFGK
ncbi:MAG: hypothetical protein Q7S21_02550 [archaeon]|nr:hypothetical protein [archaeon]